MGSCLKENAKFMTLALGPDVGNQETTHFLRLSCPIPPAGWGGGQICIEVIIRF